MSQSKTLISEIIPNFNIQELSLNDALSHFSQNVGEADMLTYEQVKHETQKSLSFRVDSFLHQELLERTTSDRDRARLGSLGLKNAGAWLNAVPNASLGLHLRPQEFRVSILYRLGIPLFMEEGPCPACSTLSDVYGDHAISCGSSGERIARHNLLRDAVFHSAATAHLAPLREEKALLPQTDLRPADVLVPHWGPGGRDLAIDVSVVNPLRLDLAARSANEAGHGLKTAYNLKWRKYGEACDEEGISFCPFIIDTFGAWHDRAASETK